MIVALRRKARQDESEPACEDRTIRLERVCQSYGVKPVEHEQIDRSSRRCGVFRPRRRGERGRLQVPPRPAFRHFGQPFVPGRLVGGGEFVARVVRAGGYSVSEVADDGRRELWRPLRHPHTRFPMLDDPDDQALLGVSRFHRLA